MTNSAIIARLIMIQFGGRRGTSKCNLIIGKNLKAHIGQKKSIQQEHIIE